MPLYRYVEAVRVDLPVWSYSVSDDGVPFTFHGVLMAAWACHIEHELLARIPCSATQDKRNMGLIPTPALLRLKNSFTFQNRQVARFSELLSLQLRRWGLLGGRVISETRFADSLFEACACLSIVYLAPGKPDHLPGYGIFGIVVRNGGWFRSMLGPVQTVSPRNSPL